jgi:hypothetical protein
MAKWYEFNNRDRVRVARRDDDFCNRRYLGHVGTITEIFYGGEHSLVGESREDPYCTVKFADGQSDGFFLTELDKVHPNTPMSIPGPTVEDGLYLMGASCS